MQKAGPAQWQGRSVDAVLVRVDTTRENAILGLYGADCMVLGWLIDTEFRITRDPVEAGCGEDAALDAWKAGRGFESVWNLVE